MKAIVLCTQQELLDEADLGGDEDAQACRALFQDLEGILICAVIPKIDGDDVSGLIQAQGHQHVCQRSPFAPVHLSAPHCQLLSTQHTTA